MYDRYDYRKGRYVTYDYQHKGDRFSRRLSPLPRVYSNVSHFDTGRQFIRRLRTNNAKHLTVSSLIKRLGPKSKDNLENACLYFRSVDNRLVLKPDPPGLPLRFTATEQRRGRRWWFICPYCRRRVGKLYFVTIKSGEVVGCQKCLGLTYPSQAGHKSPVRDKEIIMGKVQVGFDEFMRAHARERKRLQRFETTVLKLLNRFDKRLPDTDHDDG